MCSTVVFQNRLERLRQVRFQGDVESLGNGIEAHESVVTALACFALYPTNYEAAILDCHLARGRYGYDRSNDRRTSRCAYGGWIPTDIPLERLEGGEEFIGYVWDLAKRMEILA